MTDALVQALLDPKVYAHPVQELELVETHISWVILTGSFVYKIKKPVDLGFLDFSSLEKRRFYCERELELNQRLAPALYLCVVRITGDPQHPTLDGKGEAIEYAVKMAQFPQAAQLDRMLRAGTLTHAHISAAAERVASFHQGLAGIAKNSDFGGPEHVLAPVKENFLQIRQRHCDEDNGLLGDLETWIHRQYVQLVPVLTQRKSDGYIKECHGDMHLRNIAWHEEQIVIFDCIEFSDELRCIDVISEVAFMVMDLDDRERPDLASWFLNHYLERTGDYQGLRLLRFYLVYRALVRAKVDCIRTSQSDVAEQERSAALKEYQSYLHLANEYVQPSKPMVILMFGLSGSGKTYVSDRLLQALPAIRLRSDVERKRLHRLDSKDRSGSLSIDSGIYTQSASQETYEHVRNLTQSLLDSDYSVIIDAAFLYRWQRSLFLELARSRKFPVVILECTAPQTVLEKRLQERTKRGRDASDADTRVLHHQIENREPLERAEIRLRLSVDTTQDADICALTETIKHWQKL